MRTGTQLARSVSNVYSHEGNLQRSPNGSYSPLCPRGFTLIELLVVISIIGLLLSVILPSLKLARDKARDIICLSNFKQIGTCLKMYADANKNIIPGAAGKTFWMMAYAPYVGADYITNYEDLASVGGIPIFKCPRHPEKRQKIKYIASCWEESDTGGGGLANVVYLSAYKSPGTKAYMTDYEDYDPTLYMQVMLYETTLDFVQNRGYLDVWEPRQLPSFTRSGTYGIPDFDPKIHPDPRYRRVALNRHKKYGANALYYDGHSDWVYSGDNLPRLWNKK